MSFRIRKKLVAFESTTYTALEPQYLGISKERLKQYLKENPMPKDNAYSENDLIMDLTDSTGMYTLPEDIKNETIYYIEELLTEMI